ncbi:hypothetical protein GCM10009753_59560 [Streptantibioticus ferralitis]
MVSLKTVRRPPVVRARPLMWWYEAAVQFLVVLGLGSALAALFFYTTPGKG